MLGWKLCGSSILALALLALTSCRPATDLGVEPTPPMPATAVVLSHQQGFGVLVDRAERLLLTTSQTVGGRQEVDVVFPVIEDGKEKVRRDFYLTKAPRVKGQIVPLESVQALALIQLASVPEGVPELKLAAANPAKGSSVNLVVDTGLRSTLWATKSATVLGLSDEAVPAAGGERINVRIIELDLDDKFAKGSAGGPLVNEAGELVGVTAPTPAKSHLVGIAVSDIPKALIAGYRQLGAAARKKDEYGKATAYFDKSLALAPDDALTIFERGMVVFEERKWDGAVADFSKALNCKSAQSLGAKKLALIYQNRGSAHFQLGKYDLTVADCTEAINLNKEFIEAYQLRGTAYRKLKKLDLAEQDDEWVLVLRKRALTE